MLGKTSQLLTISSQLSLWITFLRKHFGGGVYFQCLKKKVFIISILIHRGALCEIKNMIKMRMLVLVEILAISLPVVLFAQTDSTTTSDTSSYFTGGCMTVSPGNTEIQTLRNQLTCVFNLVIDLSDKVKSLENRVNALESRTILTPVPTVDNGTIGCRYMENGKGMICSDGPKPVDGTDGVKIIQDFLKKEGSFTYPTATGNYGPITTNAVKQFQTKQGLTATGLVDKITLQKMQTLAPTVAPSTSTYIQQVQAP